MRLVLLAAALVAVMPPNAAAEDFSPLLLNARVPGLSMAIVRDGSDVSLIAAGVRNTSSAKPVDDHTIFSAASLSKPLFAYAVLQLIDKGALSLDTRLSTYVPQYAQDDPRAATITVRHVLSQSTGLPNWRGGEPLKTYFEPGTRFSYSGEAFVWLQAVVEKITGDPLDTAMRQLVFDPLGMRETAYVWRRTFDADYADPHDAALVAGSRGRPTRGNAAGSLLTTAADYALFLRAVLTGARLDPATARLWLEPQIRLTRNCIYCTIERPEIDMHVAWGLGWGLEPDAETFFHWGDIDKGRFKAFTMGSVKERTAVVAFTNGFAGMSIMPDLIGQVIPGRHPAFGWLNYPKYEPAAH
jgi:CubicO group peptidase (beta-lactamase class C family)